MRASPRCKKVHVKNATRFASSACASSAHAKQSCSCRSDEFLEYLEGLNARSETR